MKSPQNIVGFFICAILISMFVDEIEKIYLGEKWAILAGKFSVMALQCIDRNDMEKYRSAMRHSDICYEEALRIKCL